ncbi:MAG: inositol 2-dehydrogenase [Planctomycetota bacterium]|jgi:myo-inositol 2-dehydrogenase/D-chiro-inositol 1-dehydrogenase|nr:inositol 2-dehydrogenase [Planctomycetota bacterium]
MSDTINIGVIGTGRIGKVHINTFSNLIPGARVGAIADISLKSAQAVAKEHGIAKVYSDPGEILSDKSINAVAICSSTDTHAKLIEAAAKAGKHVFCEKPIALELAKIDQALAAVKKNKVTLMVGFNRRYDIGNARVRQAVLKGEIGKPELCLVSSRDPGTPPLDYVKVSGGLFLDMMIHDFDLVRFLLDDDPVEIFAYADCLVDPKIGKLGDVDTAIVSIRFKKGAIGHIDNSRRATYGYDQRAEVLGSKGMIKTTNLHENNTVMAVKEGYSQPPILNFFMDRYIPAYQDEARTFVKCIKEGKPSPCSGADGRLSVVMGFAAMKSLKEGRSVKISEIK